MPTKADQQQAKRVRLAAINHPLRERIMRLLVEKGVASPSEMAPSLGETTPNVSHHTKRLKNAGCVELVETRSVRGAVQHLYRAVDRPLVEADEWEQFREDCPEVADHLLGECLQVILDDAVVSAKAGVLGSDPDWHLTRTPLLVDEEGVREGLAVKERCRAEMLEVQKRSGERMAASDEKPTRVSSCLAFFKMPGD